MLLCDFASFFSTFEARKERDRTDESADEKLCKSVVIGVSEEFYCNELKKDH